MKNQRKVALAIRRARSLGKFSRTRYAVFFEICKRNLLMCFVVGLVPSTHRRNIAAENSQFAVGIGLPELS